MRVFAHGIGGRQDLPITLTQLVIAAGLALVISFLVLGARWRDPRLDVDARLGRPVPALARIVDSRAWYWWWRLAGLVFTVYFCVALFAGPDNEDNPAAGTVYVLFWVGLVPLSLLFGPVWKAVNPLRTVHLLVHLALRLDPTEGLRPLPARLGYWPAAAGLFAFVWLELVAPDRATLPVLMAWLAVYAIVNLTAAFAYGSGWFDKGDAFEVYSGVIGRLSIFGRRGDGTLVVRNPLDGIAGLRPDAGLVTVVVVLLGSTMYDSVSNAPFWLRFVQESGVPAWLTGTLGLAAVIGAVAGLFLLATREAGRRGHTSPHRTPGEMAHSVVPIVVGYLLAHYYSLLVLEGQRTLALLAKAEWTVHTGLITPVGVANVQITVIVLGHLLGTVLAHDRALRLFPRSQALRGQLPLLALMVAYTVVGLLLLYAA